MALTKDDKAEIQDMIATGIATAIATAKAGAENVPEQAKEKTTFDQRRKMAADAKAQYDAEGK